MDPWFLASYRRPSASCSPVRAGPTREIVGNSKPDVREPKADGNAMLMRRVAEINAIAKLQAMSQTKEFTQAAEAPLNVARDWSPIRFPRSPAFRKAFGAS
jgi:hypothetical protein